MQGDMNLDGFIVRLTDMQRMVRRIWTMSDGALSAQRPVCMRVNVKNRSFRRGVHYREQKVPRTR